MSFNWNLEATEEADLAEFGPDMLHFIYGSDLHTILF